MLPFLEIRFRQRRARLDSAEKLVVLLGMIETERATAAGRRVLLELRTIEPYDNFVE
ncbi:MAG: hypothetical protein ABL982_16110 [Vicinamibacterales bacterium]